MENQFKFPVCCCFGKMQAGSIRETPDKITADYFMFDKLVHRVSYQKKDSNWRIQDISGDGKVFRTSGGKSLNMAINFHMFFLNASTHPFFEKLKIELRKSGNVWTAPLFNTRNKRTIPFHRYSKAVLIRLLLSEDNDIVSKLQNLKDLPENGGHDLHSALQFNSLYESICIVKGCKGFARNLLSFVAEFFIPLALVYDAVSLFQSYGFAKSHGIERILIQEPNDSLHTIMTNFPLKTGTDEESAISVLKGLDVSDEMFEQQLNIIKRKHGAVGY